MARKKKSSSKQTSLNYRPRTVHVSAYNRSKPIRKTKRK